MTVTHIPSCVTTSPVAHRPGHDVLRIALVNNLPDAALRSTERQFCTLLAGASEGLTIKLDLYTLPGVRRGRVAEAHLAAYYEDLADLERLRPDGIIVTGTEPRESRLTDEAFWPAFTRLFDFTQRAAIPVIWSCLAAHAAVFCGDAIQRVRLPSKLSGVFDSHVVAKASDLLLGLPRRWQMPQSRLHGLPERMLIEHGYEVAARSRLTGADVFIRHEPVCQIFLQGHPEYQATSLVAEYSRDVRRFLRGEQDGFPTPPRRVFAPSVMRRLARFQNEVSRRRDIALLVSFDAILDGHAREANWASAACKFYSNWITHVSEVAGDVPAPTGWTLPARDYASGRALVETEAAD